MAPGNQNVVVPGPEGSGLSVTIPANALVGSAFVSIAPAPASAIVAPTPLQRVATVDLVFTPTSPLDGPNLTAPLILSVPAPAGTSPGAHFDFVVEGLADSPTGGLTKQLFIVDTGIASGGQIVSDTTNPVLPGFFGGGVVGVLQVSGTGYVIGRVVNGQGTGLYGVRVVDTNTNESWFSDFDGNFIVRVAGPGDVYNIEAIDGFRCVKATLPGDLDVVTDGTRTFVPSGCTEGAAGCEEHKTLTNPLVLTTDNSTTPTRSGIRNGGFEKDPTTVGVPTNCWASLTTGQLIQRGASPYRDSFNFTPAITIEPSEGDWMAALTSTNTSFEQTVLLPSLIDGVPQSDFKQLRFDYIFACSGSCPAPTGNTIGLQAEVLTPPTGPVLSSLSPPPTFKQFNGQLGWRTGEINVRTITAGTQVKVKFTVTGAAANTVVLIDNVRFDTTVVTANILTGATTTQAQVQQQIRDANVILSQTGTNVRVRRINASVNPVNATCNPGGNFNFFGSDAGSPDNGTNITYTTDTIPALPNPNAREAGVRTGEMRALTCLGPITQPTTEPNSDVHVYYVNDLFDAGAVKYGVAVTPEDYHGENPLTLVPLIYNASDPSNVFNDSAILLPTLDGLPPNDPNRPKETPAHEFGHLLMHRTIAEDTIEHGSAYGNILTRNVCLPRYGTTKCNARPILTTTQEVEFNLPDPPPADFCRVSCPH